MQEEKGMVYEEDGEEVVVWQKWKNSEWMRYVSSVFCYCCSLYGVCREKEDAKEKKEKEEQDQEQKHEKEKWRKKEKRKHNFTFSIINLPIFPFPFLNPLPHSHKILPGQTHHRNPFSRPSPYPPPLEDKAHRVKTQHTPSPFTLPFT